MSDLQALMPEGTQHLIQKIKAEKEDVFRLSTMPTASAENVGRIVQFIGTTSGGYTHGYFYECKENSGSYSWQQTDIQPDVDISGKEDKFRYTTMPTASEDNLGQVVQYLGESTQTYTQGTSYKCVAKGTTPETYEWVVFGGVKDNRIGDEITNIKVRFDDGIRPYISADLSKIIPPFANASLSDLIDISEAYYNGELSLAEIQNVWNVGDSMDITISAMSATGVGESHAEQTVSLKLVDFNHNTLVNSINGKTKAFLTLGFELAESGYLNASATNSGGWANTARRTWCNNVCINAIPEALRTNIKQITRTFESAVDDNVFIPSAKEYSGNTSFGARGSSIRSRVAGTDDNTRFAMYALQTYSPTKELHSATWCQFGYEGGNEHNGMSFIAYGSDKANRWIDANTNAGIAPHFCI